MAMLISKIVEVKHNARCEHRAARSYRQYSDERGDNYTYCCSHGNHLEALAASITWLADISQGGAACVVIFFTGGRFSTSRALSRHEGQRDQRL